MRWLVERLMARWWASLTMVKARSSRLQRVAGWSWSSVLLLATVTTCRRSSGGKAPGPTGAWGVLQAREARGDEAFTPLTDRMPVAIQLLGDLLVGRVIVGDGVPDEATPEGQGLGRGTGADQGLELVAKIRGEDDARGKRSWHKRPPCTRENNAMAEGVIMAQVGTFVQTLAANL